MIDWDRVRANSRLVRMLLASRHRLASAWQHATVATVLTAITTTFDRAGENSRLLGAGSTVQRWGRNAWLFGWLTAESEPDVIVVDLRETRTVGPILAVLDWLVGRLRGPWRRSGVRSGLGTVANSNSVKVLSIVVLVALLVNTIGSFVSGSLSAVGLVARAALAGFALVGTQVPRSAIVNSRAYRVTKAVLEPPAAESKQDSEVDSGQASEEGWNQESADDGNGSEE